jgi:hypothetical protein
MRRSFSLLLIVVVLLSGAPGLSERWISRAFAAVLSQSTTAGDPRVPQYPEVPNTEETSDSGNTAGAASIGANATPSYYGNSGMSPYTLYQGRERDEVFVADTGGELDQYLFVDSSPLNFQLPITRHYGEVDGSGYLKYPYTMMSKGIIPEYALLFIRVYDVDNDYQGSDVAPERDILRINGQVLYPSLSSGNNTWSTLTYRVPVTYLKFPAPGALGQLPTPAQNQIAIDIDTSNGGQVVWAVEVDWAGLVLPGVRPAALVNGILSGASAWDNFRHMLDLNGLVSEPVEVGGWSSIADNTDTLLRELPRVKQKYGVERLNIIAHSKGGLDSRSYLRQRQDIDTLVQLGTPNRGSECANIPLARLGAMTRNLRPDWVFENFNYREIEDNVWALNTPEMGAAPIYIYAGTQHTDRYCMFNLGRWINGVRLDPPHDGVVSTDRATLPWRWNGVDGDGIDQGNVNARMAVDHTGVHEREAIADQAVAWIRANTRIGPMSANSMSSASLATASTSETSASTQSMPAQATATEPVLNFIDAEVGALADAQVMTLTAPVAGSAPVRFQLSYVDGNPTLEVVRPDGQVLTPSTAASLGATFTAGDALMHTKFYEVAAPQAGTWTLRLKGVGVTHLFELAAGEQVAPTLEASVSKSQVSPGETVVVTAKLSDAAGAGVSGAAVTAEVRAPAATPHISLLDNGSAPDATAGDGIYSAATSATNDGYYGLRIVANTPGGGRRMTATDFAVGGSSARLAGNFAARGVDLNGDTLFDQLQASLDVQVLETGKYLVTADLVDSRGTTIATTTAATNGAVPVGTARVTLEFDGRRIYQNAVNGPYTIKNVTLARADGIALGTLAGTFNTQAYSYQAFQHARLRLTGTGSDQGVDTNGDGLFDRLQVRLGLDSDRSGTHLVTARLMTGDGREVDWTEGYAFLQAGSNQLTLVFDGQKVRRSGYSGNFVVTDLSIQGPAGSLIATEAYRTGSYVYNAFARIPTDLYVLPDDIQVNPDPASAGGRATISATIRNAGTAGGSFLAEFFLGNPAMGGTLIGSQTVAQIGAEATTTASVTWQAPLQEGSYLLYVRLNENRGLYEYDYSNNESWRSVAVTRRAIDAKVQLDPQVLQLGSQGRVVTAYIQLPQGYAPATINVASLNLNDTVMALTSPTEVVDQNGDGVPELMVKFNRQQVTALADSLLPPFMHRGLVDLNLTGSLNDGTQLIGTTTLEVIRK